ncbi:TonB family protein [Desertivirga brevis]|uniref:TonB family protein n=1 Tax=Desertivirga brevis TaxID=2810310 RepID=UPI001A9739AF|nr:TonB family protein [Pedobacter sp. SYSU D00873]
MIIKNLLILFTVTLSLFGMRRDDIPEYKGGATNLNSFISRSIIYPEYSKFNCLQGTIQVSFRLNKKGRIVESKVTKGMGIDLDEEALRVTRLTSGKWTVPASFDTTQYLTIPINFSLREYNCENKSAEEIREAIGAYRAHEDLTKVVTNYYQRRNEGNYSAESEAKILEIKEQLGLDEKFIDRLVRQANQKLKQGDKEGACEDFTFVKNLGSNKADKQIADNCKK